METPPEQPSNRFQSAKLTFTRFRQSPPAAEERSLEFAGKDLDRLVSYLPGVGSGKSSPVNGGWIAAVRIELRRARGETVNVSIDPKYRYWNEGRGDWELNKEFQAFVTSLQQRDDALPESPGPKD
jgi:hypothetical protein